MDASGANCPHCRARLRSPPFRKEDSRCPECGMDLPGGSDPSGESEAAPAQTARNAWSPGSPDEEIGSPDELTEEIGSPDELVDEVREEPAGSPSRPSARRKAPARAPRRSGRDRAATRRRSRTPLVVGAAALVLAIAIAAFEFFVDDGSPGRTAGDVPAAVEPGGGDEEPVLDARDRLLRDVDALEDGDLEGRLELARRAAGAGLEDELRRLRLEILLLDPDHADTRAAFGHVRYDGPIERYRGRWLDRDDLARVREKEPR